MNPYNYFFHPNFIPQHHYWYSTNRQPYNLYQTQPHDYASRPYLAFNQQYHNNIPNQPEIVKIEDESDHHHKAPQQQKGVSTKQNNVNSSKKKRNTVAIQYKKRQGYPSEMTRYKVKYFDPCSCPPITSHGYNLVLDTNMQISRANLLSLIPQEHANELLYPQIDSNPFICFRYRRIKKRFKKYVKLDHQIKKTESHQNSEDSESSEQQSQSRSQDSSRSAFANKKISRNKQKVMKKMKRVKKVRIRQQQKLQLNFVQI